MCALSRMSSHCRGVSPTDLYIAIAHPPVANLSVTSPSNWQELEQLEEDAPVFKLIGPVSAARPSASREHTELIRSPLPRRARSRCLRCL